MSVRQLLCFRVTLTISLKRPYLAFRNGNYLNRKCDPVFQVWPIFPIITLFSKCDPFFQVYPLFPSVTHVSECDPFNPCVTFFHKCDQYFQAWTPFFFKGDPFFPSVTHCSLFSQTFYGFLFSYLTITDVTSHVHHKFPVSFLLYIATKKACQINQIITVNSSMNAPSPTLHAKNNSCTPCVPMFSAECTIGMVMGVACR